MALLALPTTKPVRSAVPTFEPVTLDEAKVQCGIAEGTDYFNADLRRIIEAAREQVEHDTGLVAATGTYTWKFTDWPCNNYFEIPGVRPVTAISSIVYVATDGTSTTWTASEYVLETSTVIPVVRLAYLMSWPTIRGDFNGITVTLVAGYSGPTTVPKRIKQAVLFLVNHWFTNRDTVSTGTISPDIALTYDALVHGLMRSSYP